MQRCRLPMGGAVDRSQSLPFEFDGVSYEGYAGDTLASALLANGDDRLIAELVAYAVAGHHAGLPDRQGDSQATLDARTRGFIEADLDTIWKTEIEVDAAGLMPRFEWCFADKARFSFQLGFLG